MALLIELTRGCCLTPPPAPSSTTLPAGAKPAGFPTAVLSPEEADNLLRALVRTADYFLRMYRLPLGDCLAKNTSCNEYREGGDTSGDAGGGSPAGHEAADHLSSPVEGILSSLTSYVDKGPRQLGALELVQELRNGFTSGGSGGVSNFSSTGATAGATASAGAGGSPTTKDQDSRRTRATHHENGLVAALHQSVVKLREELLVTYFRFNLVVAGGTGTGGTGTGGTSSSGGRQTGVPSSSTSEGPSGANASSGPHPHPSDNRTSTTPSGSDWRQHQLLVNECGACVARHFEILFPSDSARVAFITMLSHTITASPPEESATSQSGEEKQRTFTLLDQSIDQSIN